MADNLQLSTNIGTGEVLATDDISSVHYQISKLAFGALNTATIVSASNPFPIDLYAGGTVLAVGGGVEAGALLVTMASDSTGVLSIDDNGGALTVDNAGTFATQATLQAGTAEFGKLAAGAAEIGSVKWAGTAPPIGAGVEATALRVTLSTDSTGVITVDNAGTFAVQADSVIPGTGATNLGKAIDSVVGATDTGVLILAEHREDLIHLTTADGDYDSLTIDSLGQLHVNPEGHHVFDELDATTGWSVLGNDTDNLATTTKHVMGTAALTFDKVDGAANTVFAGIQKTLSSVDLGDVSPHDILQGSFYLPTLTDVSYAFLRLGTDSTNYNEWRLDAAALTAATFETGALTIGDADYAGITGNGMDASAITYIAVGVAFNAEGNTLAGIIFDQISYHTNQHTSTSINSEVTSSINSANVNLNKVANKVTNTGAGNAGTGTQRVSISTDDVNLAAMNTSLAIIDDWDETNRAAVNLIASQVGIAGGTGVDAATVPRVTLATDIALPAGTNNIGDVDVLTTVTPTPQTSGGTLIFRSIDLDESEEEVKGSAGQVYGFLATNANAAARYLKFYDNTAAGTTVGTTTPVLTVPIPPSDGGVFVQMNHAIAFGTGITVAALTGIADADVTGAATNEVTCHVFYK